MGLDREITDNFPLMIESAMLLILMMAFISEFTYIDINTHDIYALPWGSLCYQGNTNSDCQNIEQLTNCPNGGDSCIEGKYASMMEEEIFFIAGVMVGIKVGLMVMFRRKFTGTRIFQMVVWGATPVILIWFGWEDFLYYGIRGMSIPQTLPWLDNSGLMPYVDQYITHSSDATFLSLYIVMALGFVLAVFLFAVKTKLTIDAKYKTPI